MGDEVYVDFSMVPGLVIITYFKYHKNAERVKMWKYNGNFKKINIVFQTVGKFNLRL